MILYINAPVCIYAAEKEYCTPASPVPLAKVLKGVMGSQQHWLLVAVKMHRVSGCHQSPACAGQANSCSSDRQKLLRLSVWCDQEEALSRAGIQPQSPRLSQLSPVGTQELQHHRVPLKSCLQALSGACLAHFGIKALHSHLHPGTDIDYLFLCYFDFVSVFTAYLFLSFPFLFILFCTQYINTLGFAPLN